MIQQTIYRMEKNSQKELEKRVARLEAEVKNLRSLLEGQKADDSITVSSYQKDVELNEPAGKTYDEPSFTDNIQFGENWLQRLGIGLLLLGVAFLFKYSIDQGWLIPPIRSLIGLGIGLGLFIPGLQFSDEQSPLKQIFLGGGIAVFYITGFATFQLYSFVASPLIWIFMIVVTLLALSLSLQQNQPVLSVVGIIGGLGTPFMLYTGSGSLWSLIMYTALILGGAAVMYLKKGWRSLLWTMAAGGWLVLLVGFYNNIVDVLRPAFADRLSLQLGIVICVAAFWVIPVLREVLSHRDPKRWPDPSFQNRDGTVDEHAIYVNKPSVQLMALCIPILSVLYSMGIWEITLEAWGVIAMSVALIVGYAYMPLRREGLPKLASVHGFSALILLTVSFFLLLDGDLLFTILALEGLGLRIVAGQTGDENISASSHILFGLVGIWLINGFTSYNAPELAILNLDALTQLLVIGIAGLGVPNWMEKKSSRQVYQLVAHIALLAWFFSELSTLDNGQAYVSVCWGVYAIGLLVYSFTKEQQEVRLVAMGTIFLVVGKLFLVDLSQLQAIWRILLFIGFGSVFLLISYYVQRTFINESSSAKEGDEFED